MNRVRNLEVVVFETSWSELSPVNVQSVSRDRLMERVTKKQAAVLIGRSVDTVKRARSRLPGWHMDADGVIRFPIGDLVDAGLLRLDRSQAAPPSASWANPGAGHAPTPPGTHISGSTCDHSWNDERIAAFETLIRAAVNVLLAEPVTAVPTGTTDTATPVERLPTCCPHPHP